MPTLNKIIKEVQNMIDGTKTEGYNIAITDVIVLLLGMKRPKLPVIYIVCKPWWNTRSYKALVLSKHEGLQRFVDNKDYWYLGTNYNDAMRAQVEANKRKMQNMRTR